MKINKAMQEVASAENSHSGFLKHFKFLGIGIRDFPRPNDMTEEELLRGYAAPEIEDLKGEELEILNEQFNGLQLTEVAACKNF